VNERRVGERRRRGRPTRVPGEPASERIWGYVTKREHEAIEAACAALGIDIGVLVRDAVNDYIEQCCGDSAGIYHTDKSAPAVS
jgi:hypothetical protein